MLGTYPSLNLHDPETYITATVALLCNYPQWAGSQAIDEATLADESKFIPPTRAILKPLLERAVRVHRYAREWDKAADAQIRRLAGPPPAQRPTIDQMKQQYGPTWGIHAGKPRQKSREECRQALADQIGEEQLNAIPDAGFSIDEWRQLSAAHGVIDES